MNPSKLVLLVTAAFIIFSCDTNNTDDEIVTPEAYEFARNGESTVSFSGQTTRIKMATELSVAMTDFDNSTEQLLLEMFRNQTENGGDANPYSDADLNAATKSIKSKIAASEDYFSSNTSTSAELKNQFETWISAQVNEVFPNENIQASPGVAGQIADETSTRYVSAKGFEYNQMLAKGLIGALMSDQILNNYVSVSVLDAGNNIQENTDKVTLDGKSYTNMEHKWDEAYGYLFGVAQNKAKPLATIGEDDDFLNEYVGKVNNDPDFEGIAQDIFDAYALGREAIVQNDYELRNEQANILRNKISTVLAVRAVYYLESGINALQETPKNYGAAFHDISEAYGFIFSLQFSRVPGAESAFLSKQQVDGFLAQFEAGNGLWDITPQTLSNISTQIATTFNFSVEETTN